MTSSCFAIPDNGVRISFRGLFLPHPLLASPLISVRHDEQSYVEIYNNVFHNLLDDSNSGGSSSSSRRHHASSAIPPPASQRLSRQATPPTPPPSTKIEVREHPSRGVFLSGGKGLRVPVRSAAEVMLLVSRGTKARRTTATGLNERSSRSHAILILEIEATAQSPSLSTGTAVKSENAARRGECSGKTRVTGLGRREETAEGAEIATKRRGGRRASIVDCVSIGKMQVSSALISVHERSFFLNKA